MWLGETLSGEIFVGRSYSSLFKKFVTFARQSFARKGTEFHWGLCNHSFENIVWSIMDLQSDMITKDMHLEIKTVIHNETHRC